MRTGARLALAAALLLSMARPAVALERDRELWQYALRSWGPEQGLPSISVSALAQTPDGLLWVGTMEGLARFDGFAFEHFHRANVEAFAQNEVRCLAVDHDGALWIGTVNGLIRLRDGVFEAIGLRGEVVLGVVEVAPGRRLASTLRAVYEVADGGVRELFAYEPGSPHVMHLIADGEGGAVLGYYEGKVERWTRDGQRVALGQLPGTWVGSWLALQRLPDGRLIGTASTHASEWKGGTTWSPLQAEDIETSDLNYLFQDRRGELWAADHRAGALVRLGSDGPSRLDAATGLLGSQVQAFLEDREGNVWVGTWDGGLTRIADAPFRTFTEHDGLPSNRIQSVLVARDGTVWTGTRGGLAKLASGSERFVTVPETAGERVFALAEDLDGSVVAFLNQRVLRVRRERVEEVAVPIGRLPEGIRAHFIDSRGREWWSDAFGLLIVERGRAPVSVPLPVSRGPVFAFLEEADGSMLLGTRDGLRRWREGRDLERVKTAIDPAYEVIFALLRDRRGDLWVGALDGGLAFERAGRWHHFGRAQGLPDENVHALLEDGSGHLWGSSSQGIWRLSFAEVDDFLAGRGERLRPRVFGTADGLRTKEGHGGTRPVAGRDPQGKLWFATVDGVAQVDPARVGEEPPVLARLVALEVDGEVRPAAAPLELPAGRRRVAFVFGALHLRAPERLSFRHRLAGFDPDWVAAGERRRAEYPAIPPGRYRFEVQASLDGVAWGEAATLDVAVAAFFWQRTWFYVALAGFFVALGVGLQALRMRGRLHRERETSRELGSLVELGRRLAGLLDPQAVLERLDEAMVARWGEVDRAIVARREGRPPVVRWRGEPADGLRERALVDLRDRAESVGESAAALARLGLAASAPLTSGATRFGFVALAGCDGEHDRAHLDGLAAQAAVALEGAWQAEEAVRWREVSEARREWSTLDVLGRLLFAAAARFGLSGHAGEIAVLEAVAEALERGEAARPERLQAALDRLVAAGLLSRLPGGGLRVERESWLLLPEVREPLAEIARAASQRVGGYRLIERLGSGGMAEVFRAVDVADGSPAAVKLLLPHQTDDREARRRIEREGEIVSRLDHPNLVRLLARGEHEGRLYLAMELLPGPTLAERLREGALARDEALVAAGALAAALSALHRAGVVHRDVKSSNVMRRADGTWVLLDLGLARALEASTVTQTAAVLGTLPYMAPEQLRGEEVTAAADLWALGVVLHETLTGELPWEGTTTVKMALEILRADGRAPRTFPRVADPGAAALLARLLDPDPSRRLADAGAAGRALELLAAEAR